MGFGFWDGMLGGLDFYWGGDCCCWVIGWGTVLFVPFACFVAGLGFGIGIGWGWDGGYWGFRGVVG